MRRRPGRPRPLADLWDILARAFAAAGRPPRALESYKSVFYAGATAACKVLHDRPAAEDIDDVLAGMIRECGEYAADKVGEIQIHDN